VPSENISAVTSQTPTTCPHMQRKVATLAVHSGRPPVTSDSPEKAFSELRATQVIHCAEAATTALSSVDSVRDESYRSAIDHPMDFRAVFD
jgi:hypothetical protein